MAAQTMMASSSVAVKCQAPRTAFTGLARVPVQKARNTFAARTVSNGMKTRHMMVWQPQDNKRVFGPGPPYSLSLSEHICTPIK